MRNIRIGLSVTLGACLSLVAAPHQVMPAVPAHISVGTSTVLVSSYSAAQKQERPTAPKQRKIILSQGVATQLITRIVQPKYPAEAKLAHVKGIVRVSIHIDTEGRVSNAEVVDGPELLRDAALDTVRHWTFRAYKLNGQAVAVKTTFSIPIPQ
jgi:TonB family protein